VRYVDLETDIGSLPGSHLPRAGGGQHGSSGGGEGFSSPVSSMDSGGSSDFLYDPAPATKF
jgi:hypothetical protein